MLAGIADARFTVWYYPGVVFVDKNLLSRTIYQKEAIEFGKNPKLVNFLGNNVTMRTSDGSVIHSLIPPYATILHTYIASKKWDEALKLCRFVKVKYTFVFILVSFSKLTYGIIFFLKN
jgi:intraflagellar transport protein 80